MKNFVHLHGHTEYSLLDGLSKVKKLVKTVKELGMPAVAITDHGGMFGCIEFYKECIKNEVKPIIGCEVYVAKRSHKDKEGKLDTEPYHLTLLAKNHQGYLNLMKLVSVGYLDGYYYKPRIDKELLKKYSSGLVALSGCPAGEFIRSLKQENLKDAESVAQDYLQIFGEGNYFFELQNHEYQKILKENQNLDPKIRGDLENMSRLQGVTWEAVKELSQKLGVRVVATNDFHYVAPDDAEAQDAVVCVQTGRFIKDIDRLRMIDTPNLYIRSASEMVALCTELPEAVDNTLHVANLINLELELGKPHFPIFDIPENLTSMEYLTKKANEGLKIRFKEVTPTVQERLDYELSVIEKKNYPTYFLIVSDFMNWAQDQGIITNTRGSAAGSLVLYALGVTSIDPLFYMLPFERFMNPFRPSLPDIDADMADDRRDEVIRYVVDKYGHDKVAHICTFGTMMGRAAVRDIGRVLGLPYGEVDRIAKLIPPPHQGFHKPLEDAVKEVPELSQLYRDDPNTKILLDLAKKVEGTVRHASVHAAGVVISPSDLTDFTPLMREASGDKIVTQYDMFAVGEDGVGLVKIDMLGIRNLSILEHSVKIVKENRKVEVDLKNLPLDDTKTFELLSRGDTMGLFQLEGEGMTKYLVELKPTTIFDIMAMIALYRPGPLSIIPEYISRKHHPEKISYFDPRMKSYLERSLGLLVYQDDVLLTAINLAGYNWEEVDKFRKAMGKKIPEEMAKQKDHFLEGCIKNGMSAKRAEELFKLIAPFAAYGFNKSHAASYSMVSYSTAYMKANFPVEFMAAVMTAEYGDSDKIAHAMEECKRMGIVVLPPDVNKSKVAFSIEGQTIRFGLSAIKNVGVSAIESIIKARDKEEFKSLIDLCSRVDNRLVNKKTLESLIKAGALDLLGSRAAQMAILDQCLEMVHQRNKKASLGQVNLFGDSDKPTLELPNIEEWSLEIMLGFEKELLGFYLHEPPFMAILKQAGSFGNKQISGLTDEDVGKKVIMAGLITQAKKVVTKKSNAEMAFVTISDGLKEIEVVVFPKLFQECKDCLQRDKVILLWGKVDKREDTLSLIADKILEFNPSSFDPSRVDFSTTEKEEKPKIVKVKTKEIEIHVPKGSGVEILQQINKTLRGYPGKDKVVLLLPNGGNNLRRMDLPYGIQLEDVLVKELEILLGKGAVRID